MQIVGWIYSSYLFWFAYGCCGFNPRHSNEIFILTIGENETKNK